ncbi:MAG: Fic family protein [Betaproteobacteria bacterium]|nr:Fic family protein [Betaproteobacteria bacterium]
MSPDPHRLGCSTAYVADWDANSPELLRNLHELGRKVNAAARNREPLSSEVIRAWQTLIMRGLTPTDGEPFGVFRGEAGLEDYLVEIGIHLGAPPENVGGELAKFDRKLAERLNGLDDTIRCNPFDEPSEDELESVIILCAWSHGEWVRIHPFPNGNGRTARILVNGIAQRYGLPAFMGIRPRPGSEYEMIARESLAGNWEAAIPLFKKLYAAAL